MKRLLCIILAVILILGMILTIIPAVNAAAVTTLEFSINEPQFGMFMEDAFLFCTNNDEIQISEGWFAEGSDPWTDEPVTGRFGAGTYTLFVMAGGLPPMGLQDLTQVTLNDQVVADWRFTDDLCNDLWFTVTYTVEAKTMIDTVELTMATPQAGGSIEDCQIQAAADAPYSVSGYWWDDTAGQSVSSGTFQEGHTYQLIFWACPKSGYAMNDFTRTYVNGSDDVYYYLELTTMTISGFAEYTIRGPLQPGDVNGDGSITGYDALYLLRYVLFPQRYEPAVSCDMNGDGVVTDDDAYHLLRHALFPTLYPLA